MQKNIDDAGVETLNSSDKLYVVHVKQQTKDKDRAWSAGGPLLPGLEMALARYPHTIVELEVNSSATYHYQLQLGLTSSTDCPLIMLIILANDFSDKKVKGSASQQCCSPRNMLKVSGMSLQGGQTYSALLDFTERANIDILILGNTPAAVLCMYPCT